jgi:hypothetical protein
VATGRQPNGLRDGALLALGAECEHAAFIIGQTKRDGRGEQVGLWWIPP